MKLIFPITTAVLTASLLIFTAESKAVTPKAKPAGSPVFFAKANLMSNGFASVAAGVTNPGACAQKGSSSTGTTAGIVLGDNGVPVFIGSEAAAALESQYPSSAAKPSDAAIGFIEANKTLFKLDNPSGELVVSAVKTASDGSRHVLFSQNYNGIPVWGAQIAVHISSSGKVTSVNGRYSPTPSGDFMSRLSLSGQDAIAITQTDIGKRTKLTDTDVLSLIIPGYNGPSSELVIVSDSSVTSSDGVLCWLIRIRPNFSQRWVYLVNAETGVIVKSYDESAHDTASTAQAKDALGNTVTINTTLSGTTYTLADMESNTTIYTAAGKVLSKESDAKAITSADNTWSDTTAVSAQYNLRKTYDFYNGFGRRGVDGNNAALAAIVHFTEDGSVYDNAFWGGGYMAFGDYDRFTAALDVVAHELTHGVIEKTVGLQYQSQSGALNESIADIMAAMIDPDWQIGEDLHMGAIRDLLNPGKYSQPASMSQYQNMASNVDNGGVHVNSGIPSHAVAIFTEAISRDKASKIIYRILDSLYLTPQAQFVDFRLAAIQSSTDLYGADSEETSQVKLAFDAVGIKEGAATQPPTETPPPSGGENIAFEYNSRIYFGPVSIATSSDASLATNTAIYSNTACAKTVNREGTEMVFVDTYNNLRRIDLITGKETIIDNSGEWSSVAISPNGSLLAATSIYADSSIYIFNLNDSSKSKVIHLYTPSTEGVVSYTTIYADALDWNTDGTLLMYDSFHSVPSTGGKPIEFWDVNSIDNATDQISRVNLPIENDCQVGNPFFSGTSDRYIVCDMFSDARSYQAVTAFDIYTMKRSIISENGYVKDPSGNFPNIGIGRYSPDDLSIIYQVYSATDGIYRIYKKSLAEDHMTLTGAAEYYFYGGTPLWFVVGNGTSVENGAENQPSSFSLGASYPNPFNPSTSIPFTIVKEGGYTLEVYDILGRKAATLVNGKMNAGSYNVRFDGTGLASGVYLYSLRSGSVSKTGRMMMVK